MFTIITTELFNAASKKKEIHTNKCQQHALIYKAKHKVTNILLSQPSLQTLLT